MSYQEFNNQHRAGDGEILTPEDEKLCGMCGDLKRIGAPNNFHFRVKSRISESCAADFETNPLWPFLRYAMPLTLVLLLSGFVVFSGILGGRTSDETLLAQGQSFVQTEKAPENAPAAVKETFSGNPLPEINANATAAAANVDPKRTNANAETISLTNKSSAAPKSGPNASQDEEFAGTRTEALRESRILTPLGIPSKPIILQNDTSPNNFRTNEIDVKAFLRNIGIDADFVKSGWRIKSIMPNTSASHSDLNAGDLIESADSGRLDSEKISGQSLTVKTLNIIRNGRRIAVVLRF